jgi:hypothetical protein
MSDMSVFSVAPEADSPTEYPTVKAGTYTGRLVEIKPFASRFNEGESSLVWRFVVQDKKTGEDVQVAGFSNNVFVDYGNGKQSKAVAWTKALLGGVEKVPAGTTSENLYGLEAELRIDRKRNDSGQMKNKILEVYPLDQEDEDEDFDQIPM